MPIRRFRSVADMTASLAPGPTGADGIRLACELSELAFGLRPWHFAPGVRSYRSVEEADQHRSRWDAQQAPQEAPLISGSEPRSRR